MAWGWSPAGERSLFSLNLAILLNGRENERGGLVTPAILAINCTSCTEFPWIWSFVVAFRGEVEFGSLCGEGKK